MRAAPRRAQAMALAGVLVVVVALGALLGGGALMAGHNGTTAGASAVATTREGMATSASPVATDPATAGTTPTTQSTNGPASSPTPARSLTVTFTCASATVGGSGQLCVHTRANAMLNLSVVYCDGATATNRSARADANGDYTWQWTVSTRCASGTTVTATATAKSAGQPFTETWKFSITG